MEFTIGFIQLFFWSLYLVAPLLLFLAFIVILLGLLVSKIEKWNKFDALYWALITATTVGYGDIRPVRKLSRILSILIAIVGLMLTGLIIALTINTATISFEKHIDQNKIDVVKKKFNK